VTVTRPTSGTLLTAAPRVQTEQLVAARKAARIKLNKYASIAAVNDYTLVPFTLESYGGMCSEASQLLRTLAAHSTQYTAKQFLLHAQNSISVTLQSSNANVALMCMQSHFHRHHKQFHASNAARLAARRHAASHTYFTPAHSDRLLQRLAPSLSAASASSHTADKASEEPNCFVHANPIAYVDIAAAAAPTAIAPHAAAA
jgi:hypothetical protein